MWPSGTADRPVSALWSQCTERRSRESLAWTSHRSTVEVGEASPREKSHLLHRNSTARRDLQSLESSLDVSQGSRWTLWYVVHWCVALEAMLAIDDPATTWSALPFQLHIELVSVRNIPSLLECSLSLLHLLQCRRSFESDNSSRSRNCHRRETVRDIEAETSLDLKYTAKIVIYYASKYFNGQRYANEFEGRCNNDINTTRYIIYYRYVYEPPVTIHANRSIEQTKGFDCVYKLSSCTTSQYYMGLALDTSNVPDSLPPAICLISLVNPGAPNWHDKSCSVRGSFLSISRSKKNSSVKLRACSYSIDSICLADNWASPLVSLSLLSLSNLLLGYVRLCIRWGRKLTISTDIFSPRSSSSSSSRCNYHSQTNCAVINVNKLEICTTIFYWLLSLLLIWELIFFSSLLLTNHSFFFSQ